MHDQPSVDSSQSGRSGGAYAALWFVGAAVAIGFLGQQVFALSTVNAFALGQVTTQPSRLFFALLASLAYAPLFLLLWSALCVLTPRSRSGALFRLNLVVVGVALAFAIVWKLESGMRSGGLHFGEHPFAASDVLGDPGTGPITDFVAQAVVLIVSVALAGAASLVVSRFARPVARWLVGGFAPRWVVEATRELWSADGLQPPGLGRENQE